MTTEYQDKPHLEDVDDMESKPLEGRQPHQRVTVE